MKQNFIQTALLIHKHILFQHLLYTSYKIYFLGHMH